MTTPTAKIRLRERAIQALLESRTIKQAAAHAGVAPRSLMRWLKEDAFQAAYTQAKSELLEGTINALRTIGADGVDALHKVTKDKAAPASAKVSAARAILEVLLKAVETQDFEERLARVEAKQREED